MISLLKKLFFDLTTDSDNGRFLSPKIGELVVGIVWTLYMLTNSPGDWEMWLAYAGTVMGWSSVRYYFKNKGNQPAPSDPVDPDAPKKGP